MDRRRPTGKTTSISSAPLVIASTASLCVCGYSESKKKVRND